MPITAQEKAGIGDLLLTEEQNIPILLQVAKTVTKNICDIASAQEALDYVYTHIGDTLTLLNKRAITKEILFKYLHQKKVSVSTDFTKGALISKVVEYWNTQMASTVEQESQQIWNATNGETRLHNAAVSQTTVHTHNVYFMQPAPIAAPHIQSEEQYPIHLLARKFSEWFFENYNENKLKVQDFWADVQLHLRIAATDQVNDCECAGADSVIESLMRSKLQFGFFFNPNLTHAGVQGRMDVHGLVLVLACGTLHTEQNCVGVFECTFGLLRDPFAENNWKMKTIQCVLRSQATTAAPPSLYESDTLRASLSLPVPTGALE